MEQLQNIVDDIENEIFSTLDKEIETLYTSILDSNESSDRSNKIKTHLYRQWHFSKKFKKFK